MAAETASDDRLRVACLQMEPKIRQSGQNVRRSLEPANTATVRGARLLVLVGSELSNSSVVVGAQRHIGTFRKVHR